MGREKKEKSGAGVTLTIQPEDLETLEIILTCYGDGSPMSEKEREC